MSTPARSPLVRLAQEVGGWLLLAAGVAALVLPGPGLLLIVLGLLLLAENYAWADRLLDPVKRAAFKGAAEGVRTVPKIVMSVALALGLIALGIFWGIRPAAPSWWPLKESWWLIGGWGTGAFLIFSGLVALGLIWWSIRTFRSGTATLEEVYERYGLRSTPKD